MPQPQPRQQPTLEDSQMLQRQIMLKQLQELRKHQQFQELADGRQQNYLNQHSAMNKQASRDQTSIHGASEMFTAGNMSLMPHGASAAVQGFSNGLHSQAQTQDLRLMGLVPQQLEGSFYGTPIASSRNNLNQYSHLQGSPDSALAFTKGSNNRQEKPAMQSSYGKPFLDENRNISSELHSFTNGAFPTKQFLNGKNLFGQVHVEGLGSGAVPENFQQVNSLQINTSAQEFNRRQEQTSSPEQFPGKTTNIDPSQCVATLDPLEQKILFNMDDSSWNSCFGRNTEVGTGGYTNTLECSDYLSSFPSIQSGSWSALMQSAVAEASSSDTGLQEEWSGLSFQNTELSMDNQPSNKVDGGKQQNDWLDNNVQKASTLKSKPQGLFGASNICSGFPGFQQSDIQFSNKQREGTRSDSSHESVQQQSPKVAAKWLDGNSQQCQPTKGSQPNPTNQPLRSSFPFQGFEHSDGNAQQRSISAIDCGPLLWVPEAGSPDASMAKSHDQTSISQSFGSSLEPRLQQVPNSQSSFSFQRSLQQGNHNVTSPTGPRYMGNQIQKSYFPTAAVATQSSQSTVPNMASRHPPFDLFISRGASQSNSVNRVDQQFPILEAVPVCQPALSSSFSQQAESSTRPPSLWTNALTPTRPSGTEPRELPSDWLLSSDSTNNNLQTPPWIAQDLHGQHSFEGTPSRELGAGLTNSQGFFYGEEHHEKKNSHPRILSEVVGQTSLQTGLYHGQGSVAKHLSEENASASAALLAYSHQLNFNRQHGDDKQVPTVSARDLEAFGRSLKPSNLHPNYSSVSEKKHESGADLNVQQPTGNPVSGGLNTASWMNSLPTEDVKIPSFSPEGGVELSVKLSSMPVLQNTTEEMDTRSLSYSHRDPSSSDVAFHRTEHSQVNMHMAPSWFKQYGTLKNGQMLPMYDARTVKNSVQPSPLGKHLGSSDMKTHTVTVNGADASQVGGIGPTTATMLAAVKLSSPCALPPDFGNADLSITRSKKRKVATSGLLPWHKEVMQSSKRLHSISLAELEWGKAVNRFTEKVDNEVVMIEDVHPSFWPKKRLVLTTQLMQQVFMPAPAAIISAKATLNNDSVAYYSAKLTLGDACNLSSCSRNDSSLSCTSDNMTMEKSKTCERNSEKHFSTIVEEFTSRAKKLEADLLRLDKAASVIDVIVEYKELEKFSIINRFAKFHVRGQQNAAETSPSSGSTSTVPKSFPQRYVMAFPMPRALPERAQCLSL